jgi:hypothetical protein
MREGYWPFSRLRKTIRVVSRALEKYFVVGLTVRRCACVVDADH